jgi:hypothetical protein
MPKQKGPNKIIGFMDGKIYYKMGNEYYVRNSSAPSRLKIKNDPKYQKVRANNNEFGACSSIGSGFSKAFGSVLDHFADNHIISRLTKLFANVIHQGKGEQGSRSLEILPNRELFLGFQFKEDTVFDYTFKAPYSLSISSDRKEVTFAIAAFNPKTGLVKAGGVTHFRMVLCLLTFSDYEYNITAKKYLPVEPAFHKICVPAYSHFISLAGKTESISIHGKLDIEDQLPNTLGIVVCIGIEFYQETGGKMYSLESNSCMKVGEMF